MYFDGDRKDAGATSVTDAMQNMNCKTHPTWKEFSYHLTKRQLRSNEMFTTASASTADANAENTFAGPGRVHLVSTPLTGVTFSTATTIGYLAIDYHAELMFPTNPQTGVPSRRIKEKFGDSSFIQYDSRHVSAYENFCAGCVNPPDFYTFMGCFTETGDLNYDLATRFSPDIESYNLQQFLTPNLKPNTLSVFSGRVVGPQSGMILGPAGLMGDQFSEEDSELEYSEPELFDVNH
jgi:hypothetical protein